MQNQIRDTLYELAELKYKEFSGNLLPGVDNILGVRLTELRKLGKEIAKNDSMTYLKEAKEDYFEEVMLQGIVIGLLNEEIDLVEGFIESFIPKINNWSVCDSFCAGLKITRKNPKKMWFFLQPYLKDDREFFLRFGVVMLLNYYVEEEYVDAALLALDSIKHEAYYVKMAVAWAISIYYIKLPEPTMRYLNHNTLDEFTYNKALQKITESLRIDHDTRLKIRGMKRRVNNNLDKNN